jgi:hypothetical protein
MITVAKITGYKSDCEVRLFRNKAVAIRTLGEEFQMDDTRKPPKTEAALKKLVAGQFDIEFDEMEVED